MSHRDPKSIISDGLRRGLDHLGITNVEIKRDKEYDGLPVFLVRVTFEAGVDDVVGAKVNKVTNEITNELVRIGEQAFPIFSFISRKQPANEPA